MSFNEVPLTLKPIAVILDDHKLFGDLFSGLLERFNIFKSTHTFYKEKEFLKFINNHTSDSLYLFIDYYLKENNSLSVINEIKRLCPGGKIIIVSSIVNPLLIKNILDYSPHGFLSKSSGIPIIRECIESINNKKNYICPDIKDIVKSLKKTNEIPFSKRELDILIYFAQGLSIDQTAEKAFLSRHTIIAHRRKMMEKTKTHSITELLAYCRQLDII